MLGGNNLGIMGVKRKFEQIDLNGSDCNVLAKRRLEDDVWSNDESMEARHLHYTHQREHILNTSIAKLRKNPQRRIEPSLRRSVLIFNTLRYIENEMKMDGINLAQPAVPDSFIPALDSAMEELNLDPLPTTPDHPMVPPQRTAQRSLSSVASDEFGVCNDLIGYQNHPVQLPMQINGMEDSCSVPSSSSCSMMSALTSASDLPPGSPSDLSPGATSSYTSSATPTTLTTSSNSITTFDLDSASITTTTSVVHATNTSSEALHHPPSSDIFADIDMSRYDYDSTSPFSMNTSFMSGNKLLPLSCDDIVHSFSGASFNSEQFSNSAFVSLKNDRGAFRNDGLSDDLDHIMQIIVGI